MKRRTYTRREQKVIKSEVPIEISDEEGMQLLNKSIKSKDLDVVTTLLKKYRDIFLRTLGGTYRESHTDLFEKEAYRDCPILYQTTQNSESCIKNIITYLTGKKNIDKRYITVLHKSVPYREVFDFPSLEYVKEYLAEPLWTDYFFLIPEFKRIILLRGISDLDDLTLRTIDYFERYVSPKKAENDDIISADFFYDTL